jgi:hypothetical protein
MASPYRASRSHSDTPQSLGLLWTSDQPDAETYTWKHITLTTDRHPCQRRDSNPQTQQASGRRLTLQTARPLGPFTGLDSRLYCVEYLRILRSIYFLLCTSTIYSALDKTCIVESLLLNINTTNFTVILQRHAATCSKQLRGHPHAVKIHEIQNWNFHTPHGRYNWSSTHNKQGSTHLITL